MEPTWADHRCGPATAVVPGFRGNSKHFETRNEWDLCEPTTENLDQLNPKRTGRRWIFQPGENRTLFLYTCAGVHPHIP